MTGYRRFRPVLPLTTKAKMAGGLTAGEAVKRAEAGLEVMRESCLDGIDLAMARLEAMAAKGARLDPENAYRDACEIIDLSGVSRQSGLELAARSLCRLLDAAMEDQTLDHRAFDVHVRSLRLLHRTSASEDERQMIVRGLLQVTTRRKP